MSESGDTGDPFPPPSLRLECVWGHYRWMPEPDDHGGDFFTCIIG